MCLRSVHAAALILWVTIIGGCQSNSSANAARYLAEADACVRQGDRASADLKYRKAIQSGPLFADSHFQYGMFLVGQREFPAAYSALSESVRLAPHNLKGKIALGNLVLASLFEDAKRSASLYGQLTAISEDLLRRDPDSFDGLRFRGYLAHADRRLKDAIAAFERCSDIRRNDREVAATLVQIYSQAGRAADAERVAYSVLSADERFGVLYDVLYEHLMRTGKTAAAAELLGRKRNAFPSDSAVALQLCDHERRLGRMQPMERCMDVVVNTAGRSEDTLVHAGDLYLRAGNTEKALRFYVQGEQTASSKTKYQKRQASALILANRAADALLIMDRIIAGAPHDIAARVERARLRMQIGSAEDMNAAALDLADLSRKYPNHPDVQILLAYAYKRVGNITQATAAYQKAAELAPDSVAGFLGAAEIKLNQRNFAAAFQYAEQAIAIDGGSAEARLARSASLLGLGRFAESERDSRSVLKQFPANREAMLQLGFAQLAARKFGGAEAALVRVHQLDARESRATLALAELYELTGRNEKAYALLSEPSATGSLAVREALAGLAIKKRNFGVAQRELEHILSAEPKRWTAHIKLGTLYEMQGMNEAAFKHYQRAVDLNPSDASVHRAIAFVRYATNRPGEARISYRRAYELTPNDPLIANNLAYIEAELDGDLDFAFRTARKAQQEMPDNPAIADTIGWIYYKKGMYAAAVGVFSSLVKNYPEQPTFHLHLGFALANTGKPAAARIALETAVRAGVTERDADMAQRTLRGL
jgi:Flp pilus assembly protein TadD